jgi:hypothetical protein
MKKATDRKDRLIVLNLCSICSYPKRIARYRARLATFRNFGELSECPALVFSHHLLFLDNELVQVSDQV